ncbi:MAG: hypothetical protein WBC53_01980 [Phycisphaerae bacterium]
MHVLLLQPAADARTRRHPYRYDVALLAAVLRERGHSVGLMVLEVCDETTLAAAVHETPPGLVAMYVESLSADLAFRVADTLRAVLDASLVLFGPYAALCPDEALSMRGVHAVAVAPPDVAIPAYLDAPQDGLQHLSTPGLWINCETGVMRNPSSAPPESLVGQPLSARDLYLSETLLDAAGLIDVYAARWGETLASAAPLPAPGALAPGSWPVRHQPLDAFLKEVAILAADYLNLEGFRIGNARWVSSPEWLAEFASRYPREIHLPFRTALHPPDITPDVAAHLAQAGCEEVRLDVGSGSTLIRHDILGIEITNETLEAAFHSLRRAGLRTAARVELGAAYEMPVSLEETLALLRRLDPDRIEAVLHYPAPGTRAHEAARENGWLVADPSAAYCAGRPALDLPSLTRDDVLTACEALPYAVHRPRIAALIRLARRVTIGHGRTLHELIVKPFLGPPVRPGVKP